MEPQKNSKQQKQKQQGQGQEQEQDYQQEEDQGQQMQAEQQQKQQGEQQQNQQEENGQNSGQGEQGQEEEAQQQEQQQQAEGQGQEKNASLSQNNGQEKMVDEAENAQKQAPKQDIAQNKEQSHQKQQKIDKTDPKNQSKEENKNTVVHNQQKPHNPQQNKDAIKQREKEIKKSIQQQDNQKRGAVSNLSKSQKQKYINTLQQKLNQRQLQIKLMAEKAEKQSKTITILQQKCQYINKQYSENENILKQMKKENEQKQRSIVKLNKTNQRLVEQLASYRQIGDIRQLQQKIQQLQSLLQAQSGELKLLSEQKNISELGSQQKSQLSITPKEYLQQLQRLKQINQNLQDRIKQNQYKMQQKSKQNDENIDIMNKMDGRIKSYMQKIQQLQGQRQKTVKQLEQQKTTFENKIKSLEKYIHVHSGSKKNDQPGVMGQQLEQQNDTSLKRQRQRDALLREMLSLQLQYQNLQEYQKQLKAKYQQSCKQIRNAKKQMVTKKDYEQILLKYKKCKLCLQKSIRQNKQLRASHGNKFGVISAEPEGKIISSFNNDQENNAKKYMDVFNQHVQQSIKYFKQTNDIMLNKHLEQLGQQISHKQAIIADLKQKNKQLQMLSMLVQNELIYKNSLIDQIIQQSKNVREENKRLQDQKLSIQDSLAENIFAKSALERVQAKGSMLLIRNRKLQSQKQQWKKLYQNLKSKYQLFISREPQSQKSQNEQQKQDNNQKNSKMIQEGQIEQQVSSKQVAKKISLSTSETQTEGLNQLYYKQIKQTLSCLKKFPQIIKATTQNYEKVSQEMQEQKKKLDQVNAKYNLKFRQLQTEKGQNDAWRETTRKQIINDFQDIRELVQNDRLLQCLRKAKNIIEYLEGEGEEADPAAPAAMAE